MFWDPNLIYTFAQKRNEVMSRAILGEGADLRISIYSFQDHRLRRLCAPTKDPPELTEAFFGLLGPVSPEDGVSLSLPRQSQDAVFSKRNCNRFLNRVSHLL